MQIDLTTNTNWNGNGFHSIPVSFATFCMFMWRISSHFKRTCPFRVHHQLICNQMFLYHCHLLINIRWSIWNERIKYAAALSAAVAFMTSAYYFPAETFFTFTVGWLFHLPMAFVAYLIYGLSEYVSERKHRIDVVVNPLKRWTRSCAVKWIWKGRRKRSFTKSQGKISGDKFCSIPKIMIYPRTFLRLCG